MQPEEIRRILRAAAGRPRHRWGQHFMVDQKILQEIVATAELSPADIVLEVGPGPGNLTALLAAKAGAVLAVDIDKKLLPAAARHWRGLTNVRWLCADVLAGKHLINPVVIQALPSLAQPIGISDGDRPIKLVANLPYNIASPLVAELLLRHWQTRRAALLRPSPKPEDGHAATNYGTPGDSVTGDYGCGRTAGGGSTFLGSAGAPWHWSGCLEQSAPAADAKRSESNAALKLVLTRLVFTVQWEVAQRMRAAPGTSDYGALGAFLQLLAHVRIVRSIAPGSFWPPPKVRSALVVIEPDEEKVAQVADAPHLQRTLAILFAHRRQNLANAIHHGFPSASPSEVRRLLAPAGFTSQERVQEITPRQFLRLAQTLQNLVPSMAHGLHGMRPDFLANAGPQR